jgi:hypothetical protein
MDMKRLISNIIAVRNSCREGLNGEWDRSDEGLEAMEQLLNESLEILGVDE